MSTYGTPAQYSEGYRDAAAEAHRDHMEETQALRDAAKLVIDRWAQGDLAEAVRGLEKALNEFQLSGKIDSGSDGEDTRRCECLDCGWEGAVVDLDEDELTAEDEVDVETGKTIIGKCPDCDDTVVLTEGEEA